MSFFKSKYQRQLDAIIGAIEMNMSNNYKDAAQMDLRKLEETFAEFVKEGNLKEKEIAFYEGVLATYKTKLKGYSHKDQKPYWT